MPDDLIEDLKKLRRALVMLPWTKKALTGVVDIVPTPIITIQQAIGAVDCAIEEERKLTDGK